MIGHKLFVMECQLFVKEFMQYDKGVSFIRLIAKILKPKYYIDFVAQILMFILLASPHFIAITNWACYNIIGLILLLPTMEAFVVESVLISCAFDYYYVFPKLTKKRKDFLRKEYARIIGASEK